MMSKKLILIIAGAIIAGAGIFWLMKSLISKDQGPASLKITSSPTVTVFLDNQHLGKTPYEGTVKTGEYTLKLIPESETNTLSWETKIKLASGLLTYINHDFGDQELTSGGEILTLEKITGSKAEISVLSTPDGASVILDGSPQGTTPLMLANIEAGDHEINVSASGFLERGVKIKTTPGFKLVASFQLALSTATPSASPNPASSANPSGTPKPSPKVTPTPKSTASPSAEISRPYVKILETNLTCESTTCLNVRMEPNKNATISATVKTGENYPLLDEQSGWYKIKYESTREGWISGQYAEKYE